VSETGVAEARASALRTASRRRSLRRGVNRLLTGSLVVQLVLVAVIVGATIVAAVVGLRAVTDRGAEVAAAAVLAGMADQQSGLLAYLASPGDSDTLTLYTQGRRETEAALGDLRAARGGTVEAARAAQYEADVRSWERWAEGVRTTVQAADEPLSDPTAVGEGRQLFSVVRADEGDLADRLEADSTGDSRTAVTATLVRVAAVVAGSAAVAALLLLTVRRVVRRGLEPLRALAGMAGRIVAGEHVSIPYVGRGDEVGELAQALQGWQEASSVRAILTERAPVGICRIDAAGRFMTANPALLAMLGYAGSVFEGPLTALVHPADREAVGEAHRRLTQGAIAELRMESRWLRGDGSTIWCSLVAAPVLAVGGRSESSVGILEDITERRRQMERAASIQHNLLPDEVPELAGYQLAAVCLPAQDVAGDFYDWTGPDGHGFDLTVADVMGKGVGPALVMATLRIGLRAAARELSPSARVGRLAEALTEALTDQGLFVTMFHARLDVGSGMLTYVDAGHGYGAVRRADGEMVVLRGHSMPLGVMAGEVYEEGQVRLDPGDTLLAFTDGLVEVGDETIGLDELGRTIDGARDADEMLARLIGRVRGQQGDDVTVLVLRREQP
jgi:PAS domain S-box-containing protein